MSRDERDPAERVRGCLCHGNGARISTQEFVVTMPEKRSTPRVADGYVTAWRGDLAADLVPQQQDRATSSPCATWASPTMDLLEKLKRSLEEL